MVATGPNDGGQAKELVKNPVISLKPVPTGAKEVVRDPEAIEQLQEMFPNVEKDVIEEYYVLCGGNTQKTFEFLGHQMNMFGGDEEEEQPQARPRLNQNGVSPEDVEFNLLTGNNLGGQVYDPNVISLEERKMIEQALKESETQERAAMQQARQRVPQQVANNLNVKHAQEKVKGEVKTLEQDGKRTVEKVKKEGKSC